MLIIPLSVNFTTNQTVEESIVKLFIRKEDVVRHVVGGYKRTVGDSYSL